MLLASEWIESTLALSPRDRQITVSDDNYILFQHFKSIKICFYKMELYYTTNSKVESGQQHFQCKENWFLVFVKNINQKTNKLHVKDCCKILDEHFEIPKAYLTRKCKYFFVIIAETTLKQSSNPGLFFFTVLHFFSKSGN